MRSGTGVEAAIDGLLVAGKTGTAQKADYVHGGYAEDKWTSSFVGFAPARRPRLVISVVIDEPMIAHHGGTVAAPAFRRIMEASLRHLGVVPNTPREPRSAPYAVARARRTATPRRVRPKRRSSRSARSAMVSATCRICSGRARAQRWSRCTRPGSQLTLAGSGLVTEQAPARARSCAPVR